MVLSVVDIMVKVVKTVVLAHVVEMTVEAMEAVVVAHQFAMENGAAAGGFIAGSTITR